MTTAICIASGPSLTKADVDYCKGKGLVYVVNDCYKLAPWADVLYAADGFASFANWWAAHIDNLSDFQGEKYTCDFEASRVYGLNHIGIKMNAAWGDKESIAHGGNSGFQALNLAVLHGATRVILLGYDMGDLNGIKHWFGEHKGDLNRGSNYAKWVQNFRKAAPHIKAEVINCSRRSALDCFEKRNLEDVL